MKPKLGNGERFAKLKATIAKHSGVKDAGAIAAAAGREKYGDAKMNAMAQAGKRKHSK